MTHPNGQMTSDEHVACALMHMRPTAQYEGDALDAFQLALVEAVRGVAHAMLALVEETRTAREARP